jgi:fatty-acyl-CoA synthase
MRDQGIGSWPARRGRKTPGKAALVHGDRVETYGELHARVTRLAHGLRALGVARGDRVAYLGPNHPAFLETLFATGAIGAVFVPLNTRLAAEELAHCLTDSGTSVLVYAPQHAGAVADIRERTNVRTHVALADEYEPLLAGASDEPVDEPVALDDVCMIMYTSGTTGRAKGAVLTHGNIVWNSVNTVVDVDFASDEVTLMTAPLFHTAGLNMSCLPTLLKGGTVVIEAAFDPERALDLIERHGITLMFGVPVMYDAISACERFPSADLSSVRTLMCGGAPVPLRTIDTYLGRGLTFVQGYGMTEAAPGVLMLDRAYAAEKAGTAGVPHFFTDVRLDDIDGEKGEIVVSGPNVMSGYWRNPEATGQVLADGWFHTGDVAVADADGFIRLVDRLKDMYISGGENVYPAEVEAALRTHDAVAECAVIGVPDDKWGEVGRAYAVLRPGAAATADDLLGHLLGRLAKYKIPKSVVFVGELPRTGTGKVLKKQLRTPTGDPR